MYPQRDLYKRSQMMWQGVFKTFLDDRCSDEKALIFLQLAEGDMGTL